MADCREQVLQSIKGELLMADFAPKDVSRITEIVMMKLDMYEVQERCTDLVKFDTASEQLLKMYAGTLLTEGKTKKTVEGYIRLLKRFMEDTNKPLNEVGVFDIRVWLAKMQKCVSLRTCENYRSYLSAFYQWCFREEIMEKNPMIKIQPIKYHEEVKKPFSEVELDALRSACGTLRERAEFEVLISSGARVSELCALDRSDVNFDTLELVIREGKGGKQRITYINPVCALHLKKYIATRKDCDPCLFRTKNNTRLSKCSAENDLKRIGERAGVENVYPHRCRRTFASGMAKKGMDVRTIQILMGHSDINTTMCYITLTKEHVQNEYRRYA